MRLSVILLNYNTVDLLRASLRALERYPATGSMEVIVVDNASTDGSPEAVTTEFPHARLIETGANLGFAGGNNVGLQAATGKYRLLLNSDTEVGPAALDALARCLDERPKAGACGGRLVYPDGRFQPSGSGFITLRTLLWEQLLLDKAFPRSPVFGAHFQSEASAWRPGHMEVISGACLMMRADCLRDIGLLDSNFFMYCEDVDWCLRAARAGWDRIYVPEAVITHHHGASSRSCRPEMVRIYNESRLYYFMKHEGRDAAREAKRLMVMGARLRRVGWLALSKAGRGAAWEQAAAWGEIAARTAALDLSALPEPCAGEGRL